MRKKPIYNDDGEIVGETTSYEIKDDCSNGHDMEYPQALGVIGGRCRKCGYSTMARKIKTII